jgi:hypothetical protein
MAPRIRGLKTRLNQAVEVSRRKPVLNMVNAMNIQMRVQDRFVATVPKGFHPTRVIQKALYYLSTVVGVVSLVGHKVLAFMQAATNPIRVGFGNQRGTASENFEVTEIELTIQALV